MFSNMTGAQQLTAFMCACVTIGVVVIGVVASLTQRKNKSETE